MRMRFFASPLDHQANVLRAANWRDINAEHYLQELAQQDKRGETMAIRCMRLQQEMAYELDDSPMPQAMLDECQRTNRVVIRERDIANDTTWSLHRILSIYSYRGVSCSSILNLLAKPNDMGTNLLHVMLRGMHPAEASSWIGLLYQLVERDVVQRDQNAQIVYTMLNQRAGYYSSNTQADRPVDLLTLHDAEQVHFYIDLVLMLARSGLSRQLVEPLLQTRDVSLWPHCWKQAVQLPGADLLELLMSGFVREGELKRFADRKDDLLNVVLAEESSEIRKYHLGRMLDPNTLLGQLYNHHKARNEYKALSIHHGFLRRAHEALQAPSLAEDDFVFIEVTDVPSSLFSQPKQQVSQKVVNAPLSFDNASPKADLMQ